MVIDAGPDPHQVATDLAALGVRRIDLAVASHATPTTSRGSRACWPDSRWTDRGHLSSHLRGREPWVLRIQGTLPAGCQGRCSRPDWGRTRTVSGQDVGSSPSTAGYSRTSRSSPLRVLTPVEGKATSYVERRSFRLLHCH